MLCLREIAQAEGSYTRTADGVIIYPDAKFSPNIASYHIRQTFETLPGVSSAAYSTIPFTYDEAGGF